MGRKLTPKQLLFIKEYAIDHNATQACIRAGYSVKSAARQGVQNLEHPAIAAELEAQMAARCEKLDTDADWVLKTARELVERCMQKEQVVELINGEWQATGEWKFDSAGARGALKLVGDHVNVQAFKERVEHSADDALTDLFSRIYEENEDSSPLPSGK